MEGVEQRVASAVAEAAQKQDEEWGMMMDPAEIDVIAAFLKPSTVMLEWGSGGSTMYWSKRVEKIFSIEHVPLWRDQVAAGCKQLGCENVTLLAFPPNREAFDKLGCTSRGIYEPGVLPAWCSPNFDPGWREASSEARRSVFGDYIDAASATGVERFDVVLVDGRCRGECALAALPFVDERSFVIIHDWSLEEEGPMPMSGSAEADKTLLAQEGATADGYLKLPPRSELPSYKQVLDHYEIVAEVTPATHKERCSRCGLVVLRKK